MGGYAEISERRRDRLHSRTIQSGTRCIQPWPSERYSSSEGFLMGLTKKQKIAVEAESRNTTDGDLYRYLKYVGDDTTKSEIEEALRVVLDDKTFRTVVAVFRIATQEVDCDEIAKKYQNEWLLGMSAMNGFFYFTKDPVTNENGNKSQTSRDKSQAMPFSSEEEAIAFHNENLHVRKAMIHPFTKQRRAFCSRGRTR